MNLLKIFPVLCGLAILLFQCAADKLPPPDDGNCGSLQPTYENGVKEIINRSCAYDGCHLNSAPGVFNSYNGLLSVLNSGKFRQRVIVLRGDDITGMPPDNAPDGKPKDLTEDELEIISCWLEADFPEN